MATFCGERYVGVLAACNETAGAVTIMIRNYHDDAVPPSLMRRSSWTSLG